MARNRASARAAAQTVLCEQSGIVRWARSDHRASETGPAPNGCAPWRLADVDLRRSWTCKRHGSGSSDNRHVYGASDHPVPYDVNCRSHSAGQSLGRAASHAISFASQSKRLSSPATGSVRRSPRASRQCGGSSAIRTHGQVQAVSPPSVWHLIDRHTTPCMLPVRRRGTSSARSRLSASSARVAVGFNAA